MNVHASRRPLDERCRCYSCTINDCRFPECLSIEASTAKQDLAAIGAIAAVVILVALFGLFIA